MFMMFTNALMIALREIRRNLTRSFLTVLGIIIGVSAVVTMVTLGEGTTQAVKNQISDLGSNLIMVRPGSSFGPRSSSAGVPNFTQSDITAIQEQIAGIAARRTGIKVAGRDARSTQPCVRQIGTVDVGLNGTTQRRARGAGVSHLVVVGCGAYAHIAQSKCGVGGIAVGNTGASYRLGGVTTSKNLARPSDIGAPIEGVACARICVGVVTGNSDAVDP